MKKINIVRSNREFNNIIHTGKKYVGNIFYVYMLKNDYAFNRYGVAVSTKIGNAVIRNKYKRRIRNIIDIVEIPYNGYDLIFVARQKIRSVKFNSMKNDVIKIISLIGENYEK